MISEELVKLANEGKGDFTQIRSLTSAHQYLLLYKLFRKFVPSGSKILDWGTGNGHFSYFLCRSGYKTVGFSMEDFTFKDWLKSYPDYKFVKGQTNKPVELPFKNHSFDCVVSVGVLEHVREFGGNELGSMKEISRILKPNGIFICYHLPNYYSINEFLGKLLTNKFHHQFRFTKKDIEKLTKNGGFKLIEIGRYGLLPRNSFAKLPFILRLSKSLTFFWDTLDKFLIFIFSPLCQNYFFVAKKDTTYFDTKDSVDKLISAKKTF